MGDNADVVREFCARMAGRDAEALRGYFAPDVVYHNTGMPAARGVDAVVADLAAQMAMFPDSYEYRLVHLADAGDVVLTEREDMIRGADGTLHAVPVMGSFVLAGGRIRRWTDYFDSGLVAKMLAGDDYRALVPGGDEQGEPARP